MKPLNVAFWHKRKGLVDRTREQWTDGQVVATSMLMASAHQAGACRFPSAVWVVWRDPGVEVRVFSLNGDACVSEKEFAAIRSRVELVGLARSRASGGHPVHSAAL